MHITFGIPELNGTYFEINKNRHYIFVPGEKLTDTFLDELYEHYKNNLLPFTINLKDSLTDMNDVNLIFQTDEFSVSDKTGIHSYPISFNEFYTSFIQSIKDNSIFYAAPCNYKALYKGSESILKRKFEKYREEEREILEKIEKCI